MRTTKTNVVVRIRRFVVVAVSATQVVSIVVPRATPQNAPLWASSLVGEPSAIYSKRKQAEALETPTPVISDES